MHQMSPGVERAVAGARAWAGRLGSESVRLSHLVLALLDEEEGRPAVLLERAGLAVAAVRERLSELADAPPTPAEAVLFDAARNWSLAHRHDPEFLTDAFLIVVLKADPTFERAAAGFGLDAARLEALLAGRAGPTPDGEPSHPLAVFSADPAGETDAARVLDANFNRAREAARVLEDYCRFALDDRFLTEQVKELRHGLAAAASRVPANLLLAARETQRDVGTTVSAPGEYDRGT